MVNALGDPKLEALIGRLQARSKAQEPLADEYYGGHAARGRADWSMNDEDHAFYADKLVALEPDKAEFCYGLCRAIGARRVVEIGTSFGVSTLYLAAAVRDNCRDGGMGVVIGTEHEAAKAAAARATFAKAELSAWIELREGDLRETLKSLTGPIDFALFDIWTPMAHPALELIAPHLRPGAVLCADNTAQRRTREGYSDYFGFLAANGFRTQTLPFEGGFEFTVKLG